MFKKIQKSRKISKIHFFFKYFFLVKKKKNLKKKGYPLSFPILGGRDSTRAFQSSPFQKYKNLKKSQKFNFFRDKFF